MQTFPSSETFLLASNSPPLLLNPGGDDVDIDFRDVFGGPPKRRSKVNELTRHSFSDTALRRLDVNVDNSALVPRDDLWNERNEKPVFGEDTSVRRRFTADDFFDDIFGANEPSKHIRSPAQPLPHEAESHAKQVKATEIPTFGSATASSSPLSRTSDMVGSAAKSGSDGYVSPQVVNGKGRQFHFSIYKWSNKGVPVVNWGSSRLSSMAKSEQTTLSDLRSTTFEKAGKDEKTEIDSTSKQAFSGDVSKVQEWIIFVYFLSWTSFCFFCHYR
ncbi:unnamed protein product [Brassica oleracea var. botrytis]